MEVLLLSLVFLLISFVGYILDKKILNPLFITPFLWGVLLFLFEVIPHSLYALQEQFLWAISLWVFSFFVGGLLCFRMKMRGQINLYHPKIFTIYYYMVLVFAPLALITLILEAIKVGPEYFFLRLRLINTGLDEDDTFSLGVLGYVFNFANVVCLLFTFYYEKISKFRYYIVLLLAFLLGVITLARTSLVILTIGIFVILYFKNVLRKKHYMYFLWGFVLFMIMITLMRSSHETESLNVSDTLAIYLFAGMPAFDTLKYLPNEDFGAYTLRFFYAVGNAFGGDYEVKNPILPYAYVPMPTNLYTVMFPFYKDYEYMGVALFGGLYGGIYTILHKLSSKKNILFIVMYAMFFPYLLLQFMGDFLVINTSTNLQIVIFLLIPYFLKLKR